MKDRHAARVAERGVAGVILGLPRSAKRVITASVDAVAIPTALWAALALKSETLTPPLEHTHAYFLVAVVSALLFFSILGLYRAVTRFVGPKAMLTVSSGVSLSVLVLAIFDRFFSHHQIPLSAFGIYWALALLYVGGSRFIARHLFLHTSSNRRAAARVAIYGAGDAGARVCSALLGTPDYEPVAFIDDKKSLQGSSINGVRVHDSGSLATLVRERRIDRILLAMPATTRRRRREILAALEPLGVHVQSLPNLADLLAGKAQISELCDVDVERPPGSRSGATQAETVRFLHSRQVRAGHRGGRFDRFGTVPPDHPPESEPARAVRDVRDRAVQH